MNIPSNLEIGSSWTETPTGTVFARAEAESLVWRKHTTDRGETWLTRADGLGDTVIYHNPKNTSRGFGGATLTFTLEDESTIQLKGPWSSNTQALFTSTGIDLREKHTTWGCVGRWRDYNYQNSPMGVATIGALLYFDKEPTVGPFERIRLLAERLAYDRDEILFYFEESIGGSRCGHVYPHDHLTPMKNRSFPSRDMKQKEKMYWELYYREFPHLDYRQNTKPRFKPYPLQNEEQARDSIDVWNI